MLGHQIQQNYHRDRLYYYSDIYATGLEQIKWEETRNTYKEAKFTKFSIKGNEDPNT